MSKRRVVLIGFDGANPELVQHYLPHLPAFRRVMQQGAWGPMVPVYPADTPTNWTALATGATASTSGITGFAFHEPGTSLVHSGAPSRDYARFRKAEFLWEALDRQGRRSILINYPFSWYSRDGASTAIVGGDQISGGQCEFCGEGYFITADLQPTRSGRPLELRPADAGREGMLVLRGAAKKIWTAVGAIDGGELESFEHRLAVRASSGEPASLTLATEAGEELTTLRQGEWSPYLTLATDEGQAFVRFHLLELSPDGGTVALYHSRVTRDRGFTRPAELALRLTREVGPFQPGADTTRAVAYPWRCDAALRVAHDELRTTGETFARYAELLIAENPDWDALFVQLHANDGLNHWMLGDLDPASPITTPEERAFAEKAFLENYRATDEVLGRMLDLAEREGALCTVVSDHSAVPIHTWLSLSRFLMDRGLMFFREDGTWDPRSQVRKMINGSFYVNLKGRQPDGAVEPEDYERVRDEVISILYSIRDPETGCCPIRLAARREDLAHWGAHGEGFGDVIYVMKPGYTEQFDSEERLLAARQQLYTVWPGEEEAAISRGWAKSSNLRGNHHVYPPNCEGEAFTSNRCILGFCGPGVKAGAAIAGAVTTDVAPTLARYLGIDPPAQAEGQVLADVFE